MTHIWTDIFSILFAIASIFLVFIVLLQRGRGGGLAGAFGATGGQSAFGTRAGDVFTRITIGVAVFWVALAGITGAAMSRESKGRFQSEALPESGLVPAEPPAGSPNPFEAGDQGSKSAATKATAPSKGTSPAVPAKASTVTPPPAKTPPASDATKQSAPAK